MRIVEIEFGFTKNLGNYESQRITYRATLEPWEDPSESLNLLRSKIAEEIDLPDQWHNLKHKFARQTAALEAVNARLKAMKIEIHKAEMAWDNFREFLVGHGVDPVTLTIENFRNTRSEHSPIPETEYEYPQQSSLEEAMYMYEISVADDADEGDEERHYQEFNADEESDEEESDEIVGM